MSRRLIITLIIAVIVAALIVAACLFLPKKQSNAESEAVLQSMEQMIPGFGAENSDEGTSGLGRDPLAAISINNVDIVGGLEIPSIDLRTPVTGKNLGRPCFATWVSGSPVSGQFCVSGSRDDVFRKLAKCNPGDKVVFTDVDGVQYEYTVTTQFHLKEWSDAKYDLMLSYQVDKYTYFAIICTSK